MTNQGASADTPSGAFGWRARWKKSKLCRSMCTVALAAVLVGMLAAPASAHVRFFVGGVLGVPVYPYAYYPPPAYSYPPYPYYAPYQPYPYANFGVTVPGGWVGGHGAGRPHRWGGHYRGWGSPHHRR